MINQLTFVEALKFVSLASGKKDVRYYLNGVLFELRPDSLTLVATNGHELAHARIAGQFADVFADVIVSNTDVKDALSLYKAESRDGFTVEVIDGGLSLTDSSNSRRQLSCKGCDLKFPDWRRVEPKGDPVQDMGRFAIVGDTVAAALKAAGKLDKSRPGAVVCEVYGTAAYGGVKFQPMTISSKLEGMQDPWIYSSMVKL